MEDLKRPVGRLREQLAIFEEKVRKIEAEKQAAETRAENAEKRVRIQLLVSFQFMLLFYFVHYFVMFHHFNFTLQIADLQQMAAFGAQELDTLKNRAEDAEREVRRLEKEKCVNEARTKRRVSVYLLINKPVYTTVISAFFFFFWLCRVSCIHSTDC